MHNFINIEEHVEKMSTYLSISLFETSNEI
jgi:hypothetical protein